MRPVYAGGANVGMLDFVAGANPSLTFSLFNEWGDMAWKPLTLTPADLQNGVSSWRTKIDEKELAKREKRSAS